MKTHAIRASEVERAWHVIDAAERPLGRVATQIATLLRGKHKTAYSPALDVGDYVVVINAERVVVTGKKREQKMYYSHSGYPGGLRQMAFKDLIERYPERAIEKAVRGMLPKNRIGAKQFTHLRVYAGPDHPHAGQIAASAGSTTESGS
jgi:large subunit ribosomal protein L13